MKTNSSLRALPARGIVMSAARRPGRARVPRPWSNSGASTYIAADDRREADDGGADAQGDPRRWRGAWLEAGGRRARRPDALEADSGQHQVVVDVAYDAQSYQITYKSSANMNYEHSDKKTAIHPPEVQQSGSRT